MRKSNAPSSRCNKSTIYNNNNNSANSIPNNFPAKIQQFSSSSSTFQIIKPLTTVSTITPNTELLRDVETMHMEKPSVRSLECILNLLEQTESNENHNVSVIDNDDNNELKITTTTNNPKVSQPNRIREIPITQPAQFNSLNNIQIKENKQSSGYNNKIFYNIVWGKRSTKKHKTWEGDGTLEIYNKKGIAKNIDGKYIGTISFNNNNLPIEGDQLIIGNNEIELIDRITNENEINKIVLVQSTSSSSSSSAIIGDDLSEKPNKEKYDDVMNEGNNASAPHKKSKCNSSIFKPNLIISNSKVATINRMNYNVIDNHCNPQLLDYEPLILPEPNLSHQQKFNTNKLNLTPVTIAPFLARSLREHQRDGVRFLYECIMGYNVDINNSEQELYGCILADEMGLGKTLQCISLCYTLLKTGPYGGKHIFERILIVTPSSLCMNWNAEIQKWLTGERIQSYLLDARHHQLEDFEKCKNYPFIIASYELFTKHFDKFQTINFDIMICDEGHRLKNSSIKAAQCLNQLNCKRRIILTGTPIQNDLQEFYSIINFVNPNCLGTYTEYKKYYEIPIVQSEQPNILPCFRELGEQRAQELNAITSKFILRRSQNVIRKYLPKKQEFVVFCQPTKLQQLLIERTLEYYNKQQMHNQSFTITSDMIMSDDDDDDDVDEYNHKYNDTEVEGLTTALEIIILLKKICNHPSLINQAVGGKLQRSTVGETSFNSKSLLNTLRSLLPPWSEMGSHDSGKLMIVENLLTELLPLQEKIILISYYKNTLDILEELCKYYHYKYCRLDGTTTTAIRQQIVNHFNNPKNDIFIFLLSAKAGGVGLNLIGASRLVLYDNDWNPATDLQAMSRIWRDGQKKSVYIYRLLTTGSIEEKIFQRQLSKSSLSDCIIVSSNQQQLQQQPELMRSNRTKKHLKLTDDELKNIFTVPEHFDVCETHKLLKCHCVGNGQNTNESAIQQNEETSTINNSLQMHELMSYEHYKSPIDTELLQSMCLTNSKNIINFIFRNQNDIESAVTKNHD